MRPPDLTKCQPAHPLNGPTAEVQCCLPVSAVAPKRFVPRPGKVLKVRKRANAVDAAYAAKYNEAYRRMRALPDSDPRSLKQQADVHCAFCNGAYPSPLNTSLTLQVHNSYLFFPWHRWYLYFHERILGSLIDDPTFALPYWNWDDQTHGGNRMPKIFDQKDKYPALYNGPNRNAAHGPSALARLVFSDVTTNRTLTNAEIAANNEGAIYSSLINTDTQTLFFGSAPAITDAANSSAGGLEAGPHTAIHVFVGNPENEYSEDMGDFYSAGRDPLFYSHHANVDRCWYIWDTIPGKRRELYEDADFLDASFVFYDERARLVKVRVRDAIDTEKQLGITYERSPGSALYRDKAPKPAGGIEGVVPKGKSSLPRLVSKESGDAKVRKLHSLRTITGVVQRPLASSKAAFAASRRINASDVREALVLEDVTFPRNSVADLTVFINLPRADSSTSVASAEYVGTVGSLSKESVRGARRGGPDVTDVRLGISNNINNLGIDSQPSFVISVVAGTLAPGAKPITIAGFKIEYV